MTFSRSEKTFAILAIFVVGVAQLFRSDAEKIIGAAYIFAAVLWALTGRMHPTAYWGAIAQFCVGVVMFSRGMAALGVQTSGGWSGPLIVFATWTAIGAMFMRFGWQGAHGRGREVDRDLAR